MTQHAQLGDVADIVRGIAFPKEAKSLEPLPGHIACLRTTNVQRQVEWDDLWFVPVEHVRRDEQFVRAGDILISTANSYELVGKVAPVVGVPHKATLGAFISLVRAREGVEPKYLYHQLAWGKTQARIREMASTTTNISNVSTKKLALLDLHVPPLSEQRLVVAEIEKKFSRLDEGVSNLQRVKANLKRYEAAVLNPAVQGRLVPTEAHLARSGGLDYEPATLLLVRMLRKRREQWSGRGVYQEPGSPGSSHRPVLPEGWAWASVEQVASGERYALAIGPFGSSLKVSDYESSGVPLVFVRNIRARAFRDEDAVFISPEKAAELRAHWVAGGDLLITKMGAPPGEGCVYPSHRPTAVITADCIKLRPSTILPSARYLEVAIAADVVQKQIAEITQGVAQQKISLGRFSTIAIPLPPLAEQHRIVAEIDRRLSIVREVEAEVETNLKRAQALRQSILSAAFAMRGPRETMAACRRPRP